MPCQLLNIVWKRSNHLQESPVFEKIRTSLLSLVSLLSPILGHALSVCCNLHYRCTQVRRLFYIISSITTFNTGFLGCRRENFIPESWSVQHKAEPIGLFCGTSAFLLSARYAHSIARTAPDDTQSTSLF